MAVPNSARTILVAGLALSLAVLTGCGATANQTATDTSSSSDPAKKQTSIAVTVTPPAVTLAASQTQSFSAAVTGSTNSSVNWFVNGIAGGNSSLGTISQSGVYTAPASLPASAVSISAVSVANSKASATAVVNFSAPPPPTPQVSISVSPSAVTLTPGQTQAFAAAVTGTNNSQVSWFVNGVPAGNSTLGTVTNSGLYTAPTVSTGSPVSIAAVSAADPSKSASAVVSFSTPPPPPLSGTQYYVSPVGSDGNDGSQQHPWQTIQHAAAAAQAGATVHVAAGTYSGAITTQINGTASARIRFISDAQWGAVIRASSVDIVWTNLADYVDIEGFDIAGSTANTCEGIINYASYVRIIGNHVHDVGHDATACQYGAGIVNHDNRAGQDDDVIGNVVHDIGDPSHANSLQHGIYHANLRGHIQNNLVYRCAGWGIHLWHAANQVTISNNTVFNNAYGGLLIGDGDDTGGFPPGVVNDYTVVTNNLVYRNGLQPGASGFGIEEYGNTGTHNQYLNNLVYQNGPSNWRLQNGVTDTGSIGADPQFLNYQTDGSGDYHLAATSPAFNAGTAVAAPSLDINGAPRVPGSLDIGAYQSNSAPGTWPFIQ